MCTTPANFSLEKISAYDCLLCLRAVKLNNDNTYAIICKYSCVHTLQCVCSNNSNCNQQSGNMKCVCSNNSNCNRQSKKVIRNISTFMLNFGSYILYLFLLTIRYSAFGFTLDIKISMCYLTFTLLSLTSYALYLLLLTVLQFAFGFTLDIKIRKIIQSSVLSFLGVLKVVNFLFPSLSQFFFYCWIKTCSPDILHQLCTVLFLFRSLRCAYSWFLRLRCFILILLGNIVRVYP